jgi:hypothetical protein
VVDITSFVADEADACAPLQDLHKKSRHQSNPAQPRAAP